MWYDDPFWLILAADNERPRMEPKRSNPYIVLAVAVILLTLISFGARMKPAKCCSCEVCTDITCKLCSCGVNGKCCGEKGCKKCR